MIAASPSLLRTWRFWASSAHPREAKSDSFLACAAKTKQRLAAAHTRPCTPSLSSTNMVVSLGLREMLHYIVAIGKKRKKDRQYVRDTWFSDRRQIRMFPSNRIEFNSIHNKLIVSIQQCRSLIRALGNERNMNRCYNYKYCGSVFDMFG